MGLAFYEEGAEGAELPHPPISLPIFLVVEEALCVAWERLRMNSWGGFDLLDADEDMITLKLYQVLCDEIFGKHIVDGFSHELFDKPTRAPKVSNYNGNKPDKMPDLLVGMVGRPSTVKYSSQDWMFIECKPVDVDHSIGVHYCDKGIIRFICGDYAWAMTDALMIGYARSGYTISSKLIKTLKTCKKEFHTIELPSPCPQSKAGKNNEAVHVSQHSRTFNYVETGQHAPAITLRHLWLRRD